MPKLKIDLLPKEAEEIKKINKVVAGVKLFSEVVSGVFLVVVIGIFAVYFWFNFQVQGVEKQVGTLRVQIEQSGEQEIKYRWYQEVLNKASKIIEERHDYRGIFNDLFALMPTEIQVTGVSFEEKTVIFNGQVAGVQAFARVIDRVKQLENGESQRFGEVALTKVARSTNANYTFDLELGLKK